MDAIDKELRGLLIIAIYMMKGKMASDTFQPQIKKNR
jgi:hypothetical protein